uniref:Uncharacterized protein n=1 Tax=Mycena chlorophos TaxID=658473 RepID=A0ABQ0LAI7_MYCCL|nr:predicted protein [Mycena chlorophos]
MGRSPDEIRAKDCERKACRQALRQDPEKWQVALERAREASRKYRMGCADWNNSEKRRKRAIEREQRQLTGRDLLESQPPPSKPPPSNMDAESLRETNKRLDDFRKIYSFGFQSQRAYTPIREMFNVPLSGLRAADLEMTERAWTRSVAPSISVRHPSFGTIQIDPRVLQKRILDLTLSRRISLPVHTRQQVHFMDFSFLLKHTLPIHLPPISSYDFGASFLPSKAQVALLKKLDYPTSWEASEEAEKPSRIVSDNNYEPFKILFPIDGTFTLSNYRAGNPKSSRSGHSFEASRFESCSDSTTRFEVIPDNEAVAAEARDDVGLEQAAVGANETDVALLHSEAATQQSRELNVDLDENFIDTEVLRDAVPFVRRQPRNAIADERNANFISSEGLEFLVRQPTHAAARPIVFIEHDDPSSIAKAVRELLGHLTAKPFKKIVLVDGQTNLHQSTVTRGPFYDLLRILLLQVNPPSPHIPDHARVALTGDEAMKAEEATFTTSQIFNGIMKIREWAISDELAHLNETLTEVEEEENSEEA